LTYGERLRELRAERRLSLRQVEERGGPNKDTMSLIERDVHKPHPQTLGRIAEALNMGVSELRAELEAAESPLAQAPPELEAEQRREPEVHTSSANLKGTGTVHVGEGFLLIGREGLARLLGRVERRELSANEAMDKVLEKAEIR
jgi:transcriptional regulator with XRE-family HTH domain